MGVVSVVYTLYMTFKKDGIYVGRGFHLPGAMEVWKNHFWVNKLTTNAGATATCGQYTMFFVTSYIMVWSVLPDHQTNKCWIISQWSQESPFMLLDKDSGFTEISKDGG